MYRNVICLICLNMILLLGTGVSHGADPDLVGWWRFDEGSGDITIDSSGNGNDGTLVGGATWANGKFGHGIELDGSSGYVSIPDFELTTDAITFMIWFNGWKGANWAPFISSREISRACEMKFGNNDTLHYAWNNDSSLTYLWEGGPIIPRDTWAMLAVTINPNSATAYVYTEADGLSKGTNDLEHIEQTVGALQIGHSYSSRFVQGIVDEAAIFSRALTEEEILGLVSGIGGAYVYARNPYPADGDMVEDTWVQLSWQPGELAVSHDVYFSDNFDDVNNGAASAFQGNQISESYIAGLAGFAFPEGLTPGTTYYWRIDEVNDTDPNSPWEGPVWSFRIQPNEAYNPNPADGAVFVPLDVTLAWIGGLGSKLHTVYFGDNFDGVRDATGGIPNGDTTFVPGLLEFDKTYYWRVDELNPPFTYKGEVWSFTTTLEGLGSAVKKRWEGLYLSMEELMENPDYPDNPESTEVVTEFAWNGPDTDFFGSKIEAWLYVPVTGDYTFWLNCGDVGELWLSTDEDPSNTVMIAEETWGTDLNEWGTGEEQSEPITLEAGRKYYISTFWLEAFWGDHCQVAWQGPGIPERAIIKGSYLSPYNPTSAKSPKPANRATNVKQATIISWEPGTKAVSHDVYFGTDEDAVRNATKESFEYLGNLELGEESFDPGILTNETTFFWRIDEVNDLNPASPWIGEVWTFTTAAYPVVDDFEGYIDDDTTGRAIWQHWLDGFGISSNGSQVGYITPPFTENNIVHGGSQSMPLAYNNTDGVTNSETELMLTWPRDWTEGGITALSIWFHGRPVTVGSFTEDPVGTYTMTGSGRNISQSSDEFHFAYKKLTGPGSIIARVNSIQDTDEWAKAGVMIRETLEVGSMHAFVGITPSRGVAFRARVETDNGTVSHTEGEISAPHWVKISRDKNNNFTAHHSSDGLTWVPVEGSASQIIPMNKTVYIGLAVTAADEDKTCEAVFSDVTISGDVHGQWINHDIGIESNIAAPMYLEISDATGTNVKVTHEDANAALTEEWTQWIIDLSRLSNKGIDFSDIDRIAFGLGTKANPAATGGIGVVFFDSITLLP